MPRPDPAELPEASRVARAAYAGPLAAHETQEPWVKWLHHIILVFKIHVPSRAEDEPRGSRLGIQGCQNLFGGCRCLATWLLLYLLLRPFADFVEDDAIVVACGLQHKFHGGFVLRAHSP